MPEGSEGISCICGQLGKENSRQRGRSLMGERGWHVQATARRPMGKVGRGERNGRPGQRGVW